MASKQAKKLRLISYPSLVVLIIIVIFILHFYSYSLLVQRYNGKGVADKLLLYVACALFILYLLILSIWLLANRKLKMPKLDLTTANESRESKNEPEDTLLITNI